MPFSPLDLVSAGRWEKAVFTTYALSLSFFEGVVLDALTRGRSREALILADVVGVKAALGEQGARRAGRDYQIEPVVVDDGCFHPKVGVFTSVDDAHLLISSGNLTFGGWGNNFEVLEHLHPSFARDACLDTAGFFDAIARSDRLHHGAARSCQAIADDIRQRVRADHPANPDIRVIHSLDGSIIDQVANLAADLGSARRLIVASPFWDASGRGIDALCTRLHLDEVSVHSHSGGAVEGALGGNWPWSAKTRVQPIRIDAMEEGGSGRRLHAKAFEIALDRGRLIVSGSANATFPALGATGNVEACVVRVQRDEPVFWTFAPAVAPEKSSTVDAPDETLDAVGVLRAVLDRDILSGQVLTGVKQGAASASIVTSDGPRPIGDVTVAADGGFRLRAPNLEFEAWNAGRTIVRIENDDGEAAEGFLSLAAVSAFIRRVGSAAPALLALIAMTETPSDVAAIMAWLHEDPARLPQLTQISASGSGSAETEAPETRAAVLAEIGAAGDNPFVPNGSGDGDASGSRRFLQQIYAAFRAPRKTDAVGRPGIVDDDDETDEAAVKRAATERIEKERKAREAFEGLLGLMLDESHRGRNLASALDLTLFVCDRLSVEPAEAKGWIDAILKQCERYTTPENRHGELSAAIVTFASHSGAEGQYRQARSRLQRHGLSADGDAPDFDAIAGMAILKAEGADLPAFWQDVRTARSHTEQNRAFLEDAASGVRTDRYPDLMANRDIWPVLATAFEGKSNWNRALPMRAGSEACPKCNRGLPKSEEHRLRNWSVAVAANCCKRVLLRTEA